MAILLRSSKLFRKHLKIPRAFDLDITPVSAPWVTGIHCSPFLLTTRMHTAAKVITVTESLNLINENIKRYRRVTRLDVNLLFRSIEESECIDSVQALVALKCFGNLLTEETSEDRIKLVKKLWNIIHLQKIPIDIEHYNALLTVYVENEFDFEPDDILGQIQLKYLQPNRETYQLIIQKFALKGDIDNVKKVLEKLDAAHMGMNIQIYNSLILAYGYAGDFKAVNFFLEKLKSSDVTPTPLTYQNLLLPHARRGAIDTIITTLNRYYDEEIKLTDRNIFSLIYELSMNGHASCVEQLLPYLSYGNGYYIEAQRFVLTLLNHNQDDVAFKILKTITTASIDNSVDGNRFYLKQLLKLNRPMQQIFDVCKELEVNGAARDQIISLLFAASYLGTNDLGLDIIRQLNTKNIPVKMAHFHPIFRNTSNAEEALRILEIMRSEFDLQPDFFLLRDYVINAFGPIPTDEVISNLQNGNISKNTAIVSVILHFLRDGKIIEALNLNERYKIGVHIELFQKDLLSTLIARNDVVNFAKFLRISNENQYRIKRGAGFARAEDALGEFIANTIKSLQRMSRAEVIEPLINHLIQENIRIPVGYVKTIVPFVDPMLEPRLNQLISRENAAPSKKLQYDQRIHLLSMYYATNNLVDYQRCFKEMLDDNIAMSRACYAKLVILQGENNDLPAALNTLNISRTKYPDLKLTRSQTIADLTQFLYTNKGLKESIEMLTTNSPSEINDTNNDGNLTVYGKLLNSIAATGNVEDLNILYTKLLELNYFKLTSKTDAILNVLSPSVKVHLAKGNMGKACATFSQLALDHGCLPLENELLKCLIIIDDQNNIRKVLNIMEKIVGKSESQFMLAIAYIQCDKLSEASVIFASKLSSISSKSIEKTCKMMLDNDRIDQIETFLDLTRDKKYYNKTIVWNQLLNVYRKDQTTARVTELMKDIQNARVSVGNNFVEKFNEFFKQRGEDVPFNLTDKSLKPECNDDENLMPVFSKFIADDEITRHQIVNIERLKSYLGNLISTGDVDTFEKMKQKIPRDIRFSSQIDTFTVKTYIKSGRIEQLIDQTINSVRNISNDNDTNTLEMEIPTATYFTILRDNPAVAPKLTELAIELSKKGKHRAINIVWCWYFLTNNQMASQQIWNEFLMTLDNVEFHFLSKYIESEKDEKLAKTLVDFLKSHPKLAKHRLGVAYNILLKKLINMEKYEEGFTIVNEAIANVCYQHIRSMTLERLRDGLQTIGKEFPFEILQEQTDQTADIKQK